MDPEVREEGGTARDVRIEGLALFVTGGAILALVVLAFWAGRWFERQVSPPAAASRDASGRTAKDEPRADDVTFFDTLGSGKAAEPQREAHTKTAPAEPPQVASPLAAARSGPFFVQVFAGRDRQAAEEIVRSLGGRGYPVAVEGEQEGRGTLFKVRVGGYPDRAEAQTVADRLKREGQAGAWVTRRD
ncbi:MAG: SPOR domain-containing protein [Acidobacteriia bacterium]|nr:SPOR domain-containing protein [Terriglobia bacterium]